MLVDFVAAGNAVVLSGAGLSTESGIPDYRGPTGRARRATPMTYQAFTGSAAARRRYWARSHLGWRHITHASPNRGHYAVAEANPPRPAGIAEHPLHEAEHGRRDLPVDSAERLLVARPTRLSSATR